jgi:tight adherence protein B
MDLTYALFAVLGFLSAALFVEGAYLAWNANRGPEASRMERRLRAVAQSGGGAAQTNEPTLLRDDAAQLSGIWKHFPHAAQVTTLMQQAGLTWKPSDFFGFSALCALLPAVALALASAPVWVALCSGGAAMFLPLWLVLHARKKRLGAIERTLPDALDLMARAMLAGHAFPGALRMVADEMPAPVCDEFRIVFQEVNYGVDIATALGNLTRRVPTDDIRYFVISVLIQRETGGNLGELLETIGNLIRARLRLQGTVRVLSAEGRLSAGILVVLPFVLAGVLQLINPSFLSVLWQDDAGAYVIGAAGAAMVIGVVWIRRIVRVHV